MGEQTLRIQSFTDLNAWREGHRLVLAIYKSTKEFPKEEKFVLVDQLRRCAVSITSNIAEGFSRFGKSEKRQFYRIALGSLTELQNQLLISRDLGYISKEDFDKLAAMSILVSKMINGLINPRIHSVSFP